MGKHSVLFVCLGNICRAPLGEGVLRHLVKERNLADRFEIDSCAIGSWHTGEPPHPESRRVAQENGVSLEGQRARQVTKNDFKRFNLIVAMDQSIKAELEQMRRDKKTKIICLREYDPIPEDLDVPDPFYGERDGFEEVFHIIYRCCERMLDELTPSK